MAAFVPYLAWGSRMRFKPWLSSAGFFSLRKEDGEQWYRENRVGVAELSTSQRCCIYELTNSRLEQQNQPVKARRLQLQPSVTTPILEVPLHIPRPSNTGSINHLQIQDDAGILGMRAAGQLAASVREHVGTLVQPGVTTDDIDKAAHTAIINAGAYPSLLGMCNFPKSLSTSVNECICNGIPDRRPLQDGDIVNVDVNVYLNGYHGCTSETFICGRVDKDVKQFVEVTRDCLDTAITMCGPNVNFRELGAVINDIADGCNYGVVEHVVSHGVGSYFRSAPTIYHYHNYKTGNMVVGQTFTVGPSLTMGSKRAMQWDDKWTTVTTDSSLAAQFKHTVLITETGAEVLTVSKQIEELKGYRNRFKA